MINWIKKHRKAIGFIVLYVLIIPFIINQSYKAGKGYITVWTGADYLSYIAEATGAIGTILLGIIAWKQNERLVKIEERTFLAQNAGSAILNAIMVKKINMNATNLDNHAEQIVFSVASKGISSIYDYGSISFVCRLEPLDKAQHIALVRVKRAMICIKAFDNSHEKVLEAVNESPEYSKVAISKDYDEFATTFILSATEKTEFQTVLSGRHCYLYVDLYLTLLTDKYIATELHCQADLASTTFDSKEGIRNNFKVKEDSLPKSFWEGAYVADRSNIKVKRSNDRV